VSTSSQTEHNLFYTTLRFLDIPKLVFLILFFILLVFQLQADPDYYWHLVTGQYIFEQHALPHSDIFSYTRFGEPWTLHEWLFQVALYAIYNWLGPFGASLITAFLAILALYIVYLIARRLAHGPSVAIVISVAIFLVMTPYLSPRPQLVTYALFATFLSILLGYKYFQSIKPLYFLPLLMVIWVNAHGGYIIGIVLLTVFTLCEWLYYWLFEQRDSNDKESPTRLTLVTIVTMLASAANPDFVNHWLYPFYVMDMEATKTLISEWQSPNFLLPIFQGYLLLVIGFFILQIYSKKTHDITEIIIPTFFIMTGFVSVRHIPLALLTLVPFTTRTISIGLNNTLIAHRIRTKLAPLYSRVLGQGKQLGDMEYVFNWIILLLSALALFAYYPIFHEKDHEKLNASIPLDSIDFIIDAGITGNMFNTYRFGGYILYRLYPEQRVFIDGRADMYGDEFINEYHKIYTGQPDWEELFAKYKIDYVVCEHDAAIRQLLLTRGDFSLVHDNEKHSVLVKNTPRFAALIKKYENRARDNAE
jgi:hypothetical protein